MIAAGAFQNDVPDFLFFPFFILPMLALPYALNNPHRQSVQRMLAQFIDDMLDRFRDTAVLKRISQSGDFQQLNIGSAAAGTAG